MVNTRQRKEGWHFSLSARRLWKGRSIFSRATENGPAVCAMFCVCNQVHSEVPALLRRMGFRGCFYRARSSSRTAGRAGHTYQSRPHVLSMRRLGWLRSQGVLPPPGRAERTSRPQTCSDRALGWALQTTANPTCQRTSHGGARTGGHRRRALRMLQRA